MKKILLILFVSSLTVAAVSGQKLTVTVTGVDLLKGGNVLVTPAPLDEDPSMWMMIRRGKKLPVKDGVFQTELSFPSAGIWRVMVFHDANTNKKFDHDDGGNPMEGWAIVEVTVKKAEPNPDLTIKLSYPGQTGKSGDVETVEL